MFEIIVSHQNGIRINTPNPISFSGLDASLSPSNISGTTARYAKVGSNSNNAPIFPLK